MITALASTEATSPFNGLFYATVTTIIPVLFLAYAHAHWQAVRPRSQRRG